MPVRVSSQCSGRMREGSFREQLPEAEVGSNGGSSRLKVGQRPGGGVESLVDAVESGRVRLPLSLPW